MTVDPAKVSTGSTTVCVGNVSVDVGPAAAFIRARVLVPMTSAVAEGAKDIVVPETVMGAAPGISRSLLMMYCPTALAVNVEPPIVKIGAATRAWVLLPITTVEPEGSRDTKVPEMVTGGPPGAIV